MVRKKILQCQHVRYYIDKRRKYDKKKIKSIHMVISEAVEYMSNKIKRFPQLFFSVPMNIKIPQYAVMHYCY